MLNLIAFLYFLPTIIGLIRFRRDVFPLFVINFFFGWTIVIWLMLMAIVLLED